MANLALAAAPLAVEGAEIVGPKAVQLGKRVLPKVGQAVKENVPKAVELGEKAIGTGFQAVKENAPKVIPEAGKAVSKGSKFISGAKKVGESIILGGVLPAIGFSLVPSLASQPSSQANPDISNADLVEAHRKSGGDMKKLKKHKFSNGKTFAEVQKDFIKAHKDKLIKAHKNPKLLYKKNGHPTKINLQAKLHGIKLD